MIADEPVGAVPSGNRRRHRRRAAWYDERSEGLGRAFLEACSEALLRIERNPDWVAADADRIRSLRLHRFPYVIHYRLDGAEIMVVAIMFGGRDPSAWQARG